jgi:hypothetical protein
MVVEIANHKHSDHKDIKIPQIINSTIIIFYFLKEYISFDLAPT